MVIKQLQLSYYSPSNSHLLGLGKKILTLFDPKHKFIKFLQILDSNLKEMYSKLFFKDQKLFKEQF